jgi:hypothetical protein
MSSRVTGLREENCAKRIQKSSPGNLIARPALLNGWCVSV